MRHATRTAGGQAPTCAPNREPTDRLHGCGKGRSDGWWKGLAGVLVAEGLLQYHTPSGTDMQVVRVSEAGKWLTVYWRSSWHVARQARGRWAGAVQ